MTSRDPDEVLARLRRLRESDAPTHGGRILSYVYDSGLGVLDRLAADAAELVRPVNGLDPTVFGSVAAMERDLIEFSRSAFGSPDAVGTVTSGGTESCLLAVAAARRTSGLPRGHGNVVAPSTAHAAFDKAAELLGVDLRRVPVDPDSTRPSAADVAAHVDDETFLLVASAPNYPTGTMDPIAEFGALALERGLPLHVDACLGGFALAWWPEPSDPWDLSVPGVTSLSADFHKYGYAPKGASILLHTDRDRHRAGYFATADWPGYPVVNPTLLGSRSATGTAAAWAITQFLGPEGFAGLVGDVAAARTALLEQICAIDGLRVVGDPFGPVFAVAADHASARPIDPHRWADEVHARGFTLQAQPRYRQSDGSELAASTHLTITPVTRTVAAELSAAMVDAATAARALPPIDAPGPLRELAAAFESGAVTVEDAVGLDSAATEAVLIGAGIDPHSDPARSEEALDIGAVIAAIDLLPRPVTAKMLIEFLAAFTNPPPAGTGTTVRAR
ncbi:pyridoxal phosphate-dependent decarboxylase family protein [Gordonia sp. LUNF6]|uniref:pyridoxal phosphate-dependent decarboxylase family protein n=1 Tax=Gordonia TaxID=2053 RepID=UPI000780BC6D|nr:MULTISPECIES: aminotransferase class V-fold PLP-dependent enzyme [Gordonia]KXT56555.1 pyridoxal-dependent decarboxylase [Gordonia sp. QH-12]WFN94259.1 aminotransferase class V-fold PLP-dependent enzyme [Gordonia sihwensis]